MVRVLRAFAWMRWRVLVNSLERTGARDTLERFSIALEQIAPIVALVLLVPSALASAALGAAAGYALAEGGSAPLLLQVCRFALLASLVVCVVGPIAMPAAERTNPVRLLLLPISRSTLYVAQMASTLADPWILLAIPVALVLPAGLAAGGALGAAAGALLAGALLLIILTGITALVASVLHLVARDRRRGELVALFFIFVFPMIALVPALSAVEDDERDPRTRGTRHVAPAWLRTVQRLTPYVPTEQYVTAVQRAATGARGASGASLGALAAAAAAVHTIGFVAYRRLLDTPGTASAGRRAGRARWSLTIPGVSSATSAVALAQLRLASRTSRGRAILLSPLIVVVVFGVLLSRGSSAMRFGFLVLEGGVGLAACGAAAALLAILPIAMNQFAVDRAGLTLALLSPLSDRELLAGKAIGNGLIVAGPTLLCVTAALIAFPGGSPWLWVSVPLAIAATYVLAAPAAAAFSAIFPRAVDMNSIGSRSNAHAAAALLGVLAFVAAGAPCVLLVLIATRVLGQPALAPLFLLAWLGTAVAVAAALFIPVRKLFARRRENLAMVA